MSETRQRGLPARRPPTGTATTLCAALAWSAALGACNKTAPTLPVAKDHCAVGTPPVEAHQLELVPAFEHVEFTPEQKHRLIELVPSPWLPGAWYLVRQHGEILRIHENPSQREPEPVFDISEEPRLYTGPEEAGITSLAFHPTRREAYIVYTAPTEAEGARLESRLARYAVDEAGHIDPDSEELLLTLPQPRPAHSGDQLLFGPDGMLYFSSGDGGLPQDGAGHGQDPHSLYGAILRIDVDATDPGRETRYAIPEDNPFADGEEGAPEVFAYGLRNPWRFSFDRETGDLWAGDVGENDWEEINRVVPGGNYGWSIREGHECFEATSCPEDGLEPPVVAYPHEDGVSVTGGFVYRGGDVPGLRGRYVYADYIFGTLWSVDATSEPGGDPDVRVEAEAPFWISSFAESPAGELYVVNFTFGDADRPREGEGGLYRLAPAAPPPERDASRFPERLSETLCVNMDQPRRPASGMRRFTPRSPLWSDGSDKDRFLYVPEGAHVEVTEDGDFLFPEDTILVKHFRYGSRLHETRLLVHHEEAGWRGYSYRWNDAQSDATLLETGENEVLKNGQFWRYPSRTQCMFCHTEAAGFVLGPEAAQLDFALGTDDDASTQLQAWHGAGLFASDMTLESLESSRALVDPYDDAPVARRARSYLHANCANCHQPDGQARVDFDLRYQTSLEETGVCNVEASLGTLGGDPDERRLIVPGDPDNSVLWLRMQSEGGPRMPPLGTTQVDDEAVMVVRDWIAGMRGCR